MSSRPRDFRPSRRHGFDDDHFDPPQIWLVADSFIAFGMGNNEQLPGYDPADMRFPDIEQQPAKSPAELVR